MTRQRTPRLAAPIALATAILLSLLPLTTLLIPSWFFPSALAVIVVVAAGYAGRWVGRGAAIGAEIIVWLIATAWAFPGPVLGGLVPWGGAWLVPDVIIAASEEIVSGIAPVDVGAPLTFVLVSAVALIAIVVDAVAISARLPLLAAIPLVAVFVIPQLAVPRGDHLALAVPFALALLALVALAGRPSRRRPPRRGSVGAIGLAVVSVLVALVVAPRIPVLPAADAGAFARPTSIDVSIDLGDDLRNRSTEEVLRVRTDQGPTPYLRLATHTRFDENGWQLDGGASRPLEEGFERADPSGVVGDIESERVRTWVSDVELDTEYLPLPGDAVAIDGTTGEWNAMLESRTARSSSASSKNERYRADSFPRSPTRAQFDASPWVADAGIGGVFAASSGEGIREDIPRSALEVPDAVVDGPIGQAAREVTSEESTPYGAALRLQEWLRSSAFSYSLDTPVAEGFDGSDIDAVEKFLEVRAGYCVHFASTYALMARSLGIPTRVTIGYLPGDLTGEDVDGMSVYSVTANRLHAWPEVYLVGIGWTPFDPTPAIAQAQSIVLDTSGGDVDSPEQTRAPDEAEDETTEPSAEPSDEAEEANGSADSPLGGDAATIWLVIVFVVLGALVITAIPAVVRMAIAAARLNAARGGDVVVSWRELRAIAIDAGLETPDAESPRAFGSRLSAEGAPAGDVDALVGAIERRSFARSEPARTDLSAPLRRIRRALRPDGFGATLRAWAFPRSLWARRRSVDRDASPRS